MEDDHKIDPLEDLFNRVESEIEDYINKESIKGEHIMEDDHKIDPVEDLFNRVKLEIEEEVNEEYKQRIKDVVSRRRKALMVLSNIEDELIDLKIEIGKNIGGR